MANVLRFTGGKRCIVCGDQIDPERVRTNPDVVTCEAGCSVGKTINADWRLNADGRLRPTQDAIDRDTLTISG